MQRATLAAIVPVLFAFTRGEEHTLAARYPVGLALTEESAGVFAIEATGATVTMNGMELPPEAVEQMGVAEMSERTVRTSRILHVIEASDADRPKRLRRTYEQLERSKAKRGETQEESGVLAGETLVLTDEDGEVTAELVGDREVDEVYLTHHRLTRRTDRLLPEEEVAVGATWEVEGEDLFHFLGMGVGPELFELNDDSGSGFDFEEAMREHGDISCEVTFDSIVEVDGVRCALLTYEVELHGELEGLDGDFFGAEQEMEGTFQADLTSTGKLWLALDAGYPVRSTGTIEGDLEMVMEMEVEAQGQTFQMVVTLEISAEGSGETTWELGEDD